jgi:hypothetical protein
MGVVTAADRYLEETRDHVNNAIKTLSSILVDECWGHDDFNAETSKDMRDALYSLMEIRDKLRL